MKKPNLIDKVRESMSPELKSRKTFGRLMGSYAFDDPKGVAEDIREKYGYDGDLLQILSENKEYAVHKWHHYIPLYDKYFSRFRGRPIRFLEIGVSEGGSLQMWRRFLGEDAIIFGIDINPQCAHFDGDAAQVRIGSQDDPEFLNSVVEEMGGIDVVLDDGSHHMPHLRASLRTLFPRLNTGGVYFVEDLHTAFWPNYSGGMDADANFFNLVRDIMDDMHTWYHDQGVGRPGIGDAVSGLHVYDSVVVLEKGPVYRPVHSKLS